MGVYQDIQTDVKEAMKTDLFDAVTTLTITVEAPSVTYDPTIGVGDAAVVSVPVIYTMDCIFLGNDEENKDEMDTSTNFVKLIVLDSDRTVPEFIVGMKANVRGNDYEIGKVGIDPVAAAFTLKCRRI